MAGKTTAKPAGSSKAAPAKAAPAKAAPPAAPTKATPAKAAGAKGGGDLRAQFEAAASRAKQAKQKPSDQTLLKLYAYYKQATEGDVSGPQPGFLDFVGRAKHDAWGKLKGMGADEAMQNYIKQVDKLDRD